MRCSLSCFTVWYSEYKSDSGHLLLLFSLMHVQDSFLHSEAVKEEFGIIFLVFLLVFVDVVQCRVHSASAQQMLDLPWEMSMIFCLNICSHHENKKSPCVKIYFHLDFLALNIRQPRRKPWQVLERKPLRQHQLPPSSCNRKMSDHQCIWPL